MKIILFYFISHLQFSVHYDAYSLLHFHCQEREMMVYLGGVDREREENSQ